MFVVTLQGMTSNGSGSRLTCAVDVLWKAELLSAVVGG